MRAVFKPDRGSAPEAAFAKDLAGNYDETRWHKHGAGMFISLPKTWKEPSPKSEGDVFSVPDGRFIWSFFLLYILVHMMDMYTIL